MILSANYKFSTVWLLLALFLLFSLQQVLAGEFFGYSGPRAESYREQNNIVPSRMQAEMQSEMQAKMQAEMQATMKGRMFQENQPKMQEQMMLENRDKILNSQSGLSAEILAEQSESPVKMPTMEAAARQALQAAKSTAASLIDRDFHKNGRTLVVPVDFATIRKAIDAARSGDTVIVKAGIYHEQLVMKDGVKLVSYDPKGGEELVAVDGAMLHLPKRSLTTIIDGTGQKPSEHGMIDFDPGLGSHTLVDGFTIRNLPRQDHHIPGHAHSLNIRGANPVITNCLIVDNGSTGIGNHVIFKDQDSSMPGRNFRYENIKHFSSAVLYNNIIRGSFGLGIGCNHFSTPFVLGNEIFANSDAGLSEGAPSPGIGNKHGSAPTIIGNLIHDNPGGGVLSKAGEAQGRYPIDRPGYPAVISNLIFNNGDSRPGISSVGVGTEENPVIIAGNFLYNSGAGSIVMRDKSVGIIENNMISKSAEPSIAINGSTVLRLNYNQIVGSGEFPEILILNNGLVREMRGNAVDTKGGGPKFMVRREGLLPMR